jgi:hypothetical protein
MSTSNPTTPPIPIDYEQLKGSERRPSPNAKLLGPADPNETFSVTIVLRRRIDGPPIPDFDYFATTPLSQRRRMPEDEFAANYGAAPDDIAKVVDFANGQKLTVVETHAARRTVVVSGTVERMSAAFALALGRYERIMNLSLGKMPRPETWRGRDGFIYLPKTLTDIVVGVFGLDNRRVTKANSGSGDPTVTNPISLQQITTLYKFPKPGPAIADQTIGIVSAGAGLGGYLTADIDQYFGTINLTAPLVVPISVDGVPNGTTLAMTTAETPAGSNTLTCAPAPNILERSRGSITAMGTTYYILVATASSSATATTLTVDIADPVTGIFDVTAFSGVVPANTSFYLNLDDETNQDICIAAATAPGATVAVYFSSGTQSGWVDTIKRAIHPNANDFTGNVSPPSVLSSSFSLAPGDDPDGLTYSDANWSTSITANGVQAVHEAFQDAALQGLTVCIASGDMGTNSWVGSLATSTSPTTGDGYAHAVYPASDPWVLAVGGTTLGQYQTPTAGNQYWVEYVWNDAGTSDPGYPWGTTGGGVSDVFPVPSYQSNVAVPQSLNVTIGPNPAGATVHPPAPFSKTGRGVPDVAGNASVHSGYSGLFLGGQPAGPGNGTSASTPLWAGLVALINSNLGFNIGFLNPILYVLGESVFNPINPLYPDPTYGVGQLTGCPADNGNNGIPGYKAGPGWDACTGWGSPNGTALLAALKQQLGQDCYFIVDQAVFGEGTVKAELAEASTAVFDEAFFVVIDEFTPNQLGITAATVANAVMTPPTVEPKFSTPPNGMSYKLTSVQPASSSLLSTNPDAPQRLTYAYNVVFSNADPFPTTSGQTTSLTVSANVTAKINGSDVTVSCGTVIQLDSLVDPYFAGGSATSWLSADLRVFQAEPGPWTLPPSPGSTMPTPTEIVLQNTGKPTVDAPGFITNVISLFSNVPVPPPHHPFDLLLTGEAASQLDTLPTDPSNQNPVYNFAVARVRYNTAATPARSVRVFFRLIPALSTSVAYDLTTNYRRWSDGMEYGQAIPLLGIDPTSIDVVTIPCFASARIDASTASLDTQLDGANVQNINAPTGGATESYAYFGCWLDLNQINSPVLPMNVKGMDPDGPFPTSSLFTVQQCLRGLHQCLVAEIAFDPDPIPSGYSPTFTGPLAQRNLSLLPAANPGDAGSRSVPNTFTVRPTAPNVSNAAVDELMIDWGNTPVGSVASIYWPGVDADQILQLAALSYANAAQSLTPLDAHTIQVQIGGITYIPIPPASGAILPGLITLDLPFGIREGQNFSIVVRQVTHISGQSSRTVASTDWRSIVGTFQLTIPVSTKSAMLPAEIRSLALVRWIQQSIPATDIWAPVFDRYVAQIVERVRGLGGDPSLIQASPTGGVTGGQGSGTTGRGPLVDDGMEYTGKVEGLRYDRFGDFEGFVLRTEQNDELWFRSAETRIEALVRFAWEARVVISVLARANEPHVPASIVLRRIAAPPRF